MRNKKLKIVSTNLAMALASSTSLLATSGCDANGNFTPLGEELVAIGNAIAIESASSNAGSGSYQGGGGMGCGGRPCGGGSCSIQ
ncbi:hypothetical protein ACXN5S_03840 [Pseudoroseicyclus sp. H15]